MSNFFFNKTNLQRYIVSVKNSAVNSTSHPRNGVSSNADSPGHSYWQPPQESFSSHVESGIYATITSLKQSTTSNFCYYASTEWAVEAKRTIELQESILWQLRAAVTRNGSHKMIESQVFTRQTSFLIRVCGKANATGATFSISLKNGR